MAETSRAETSVVSEYCFHYLDFAPEQFKRRLQLIAPSLLSTSADTLNSNLALRAKPNTAGDAEPLTLQAFPAVGDNVKRC